MLSSAASCLRVLLAGTALLLSLSDAARAQRAERGKPGVFDFYVLALSWSPGFCAVERGAARLDQCAAGQGLHFVVHGLWPQYERGYPRECASGTQAPSRATLTFADTIFPSRELARHQWRMHGSCSGKGPLTYFLDTARARAMVAIPTTMKGVRDARRVTPADVEQAFIEANPGLERGMIAPMCRDGRFTEVRICLDRDLQGFRACPEVDRAGCRDRRVLIEAPR